MMTSIDTTLIYEDELEWLHGALLSREKERIGRGQRPSINPEWIFDTDYLWDLMRWLKYGVMPD